MSGFDPETWLHSLEYDDGDVEPAIRLWREVCHLGVPEDTRADEENATREAKRRKVAETEIAEARKGHVGANLGEFILILVWAI